MKPEMASKSIVIDQTRDQRPQIKEYFIETWLLYEQLFDIISSEEAFYLRAQPLRHPLIFYFGHTATFYVNKLIDAGIIKKRINEKFEFMFAVGVDQMDWDDLNEIHYDWPLVSEVRQYRKFVRSTIEKLIDDIDPTITWDSDLWIILMGIEHQRIHLETSAVIIRRLDIKYINKGTPHFLDCPSTETDLQKIPKNKLIDVDSWEDDLEMSIGQVKQYGWDNQFGKHHIKVGSFKASEMLVSNGQYYEFMKSKGYIQSKYWSQEGKAWLKSVKVTKPTFWVWDEKINNYKLRTMLNQIEMPWDWPVEVNNLQAQAFCNWKSELTGLNYRLPTEDQYQTIRNIIPEDQTEWDYQSVGNINMEYWISPNPVNMFKKGGFCDVIGNVWQHTITPIYPYQGFEIHPLYEDFTTPTFDTLHNLIKGGSFISTGNEAMKKSRYAFRRHFYQFAGFRYVISDNEAQINHLEDQSDQKVRQCLKNHYANKKSYIEESLKHIQRIIKEKQQNPQSNRCLTIGCSVGRIPFQMTKYFGQSFGIDYTARYFQMATRLNETKEINYKNLNIKLDSFDFKPEKIQLFQFNPENPDPKKLDRFDFVFIDGTALRNGKLSGVFQKSRILMKQKCLVMVLENTTTNEFKEIILDNMNILQKIPIRESIYDHELNLYILENE